MGRAAAVFTLVFAITLPNGSPIFVGRVPYLGPEKLATVGAYEPGGKDAVAAVFPSQAFTPSHFQLNDLPLFRRDDCFMALLNIVLRCFSLIDFLAFR